VTKVSDQEPEVHQDLQRTKRYALCAFGIIVLFGGMTLTAVVAENVLKITHPLGHNATMLAGVALFIVGLLVTDYNHKALR
jgi:hypothetical protein